MLGKDILPPLLITFGLSVALQNGMLEVVAADSQRLRAGALESASIDLGLVTVGTLPLLTFASAVAAIFALNRIFYATAPGRTFRATAVDPLTASLMGINPSPSSHLPQVWPWSSSRSRRCIWHAGELRPPAPDGQQCLLRVAGG